MTGQPEPTRAPEVDEVLRRVGRNLLLFQLIEHLLKQLTGSARVEGTASSVQAKLEARRARIHRQSLGQIARQFADDVLADAGDRDGPENLSEMWISFTFNLSKDSAFVEQHNAEMQAIVDARNDLIHHFLPRWSPASEESTREALSYLDEQRAQALPMRDRLLSLATWYEQGAKEHAEFMASPEGGRQLALHLLRARPLVLLLAELATRTDRTDGWMVLATAGHVIKRLEPEELEHLFERYGHRTLKKLMEATEMFNIADEPTPKGGIRTIYRLNPRFELQIQCDAAGS